MRTVVNFGRHRDRIVEELETETLIAFVTGLRGSVHENGPVHQAATVELNRRQERGDPTERFTVRPLELRTDLALVLFPIIASLHVYEHGPADIEWKDVVDETFDVAELVLERCRR
jgi:hypothetical protein